MNNLPFPGPLTLGELLDRTFRLYRRHFGKFLLAAAIFLVPYGLVSALLSGRMMTDYFSMLVGGVQVAPDATGLVGGLTGLSLLLTPLGLAASAFTMLTLTSLSIGALHGDVPSLGQVMRRVARRFWAFVGSSLLSYGAIGLISGVLFAGLAVAVVAVGAALGGIATLTIPEGNTGAQTVAFMGLGALLMCVYAVVGLLALTPIVYLLARWAVSTPGLVDQGWGPVEALRGSWRLTRGAALRCTGYLLLVWVLGVAITSVPTYLVQMLIFVVLPTELLGYGTAIMLAMGSLLSVFWQPIYAIAVTLLYFDLRVRKESYDLRLQVEQLEAQLAPALPAPEPPALQHPSST